MEERRDEGAGELADQLEQDAERLRERQESLESDIEGAKSDWRARQADASIPGAQDEAALHDDAVDEEDAHQTGAAEDETESSADTGSSPGNDRGKASAEDENEASGDAG